MANLLARFQMVDEMSSRLDQLAQRGQTIVTSFERLGDIGTAAFSGIERGASSAVTTADGVAHSLSDLVGTTGNAASHTDALSESLSRYGDAAGTAASHTDDWADSIEDYGESASTAADAAQSLADAGEKSAEALREQERRFDECELSAHALSRTMEEAADTQKDLSEAMERASRTASELADNENVSTEAKEELARAAETAEDAMRGLEAAQNEAVAAMENYDAVLTSGTDNMDELEAAAERNRQAAENLAEADGKAADAARELSEATDRAADEAERSSKRGQDAAQKLGNVLAAAGIAAAINKIKDAFLDASNAAAAFQTGIAKVSTIADTTNVSLGEIESQISALSRETGQSVTGLSEAVYSAISASVDTASAVEFTGTATKLAAGGFTAASTAVDVLTTALNAYGLEASEAGSISDMLITTQNLGKTSVDELASSVGKVIPLAAAYGVEMDNLSAAYAELTKGGIATAESGTYLKSMLNELGDSASTVSTTLIEQTGYSFAELTKQGYSLGDVMEVLGNSVQGDAGAFNELWSSSEAGIGALSLYNAGAAQFNTTLDAMWNSVGATESAYSAMTNTVEHSQEALSVASENLNIAIGQNLNPLVQSLYDGGTRLLNTMTEFATEHPLAVKALAAIAIGVGGVTAAIAAASGVATLASATIMPFFAGLAAAMGPVGLLIAGFAAAGVAIGAFAAMAGDASDETLAMTATTRKQYLELQDLNAQYEEACAKYGETSDQASSLKWQIDDLTASLEANGKTVEQLAAECDSVIDKHNQLINSTNSATQAVKDQEVQNLALIAKLESMASAANISAESQGVMEGIIKELNRNIDGLNLSYEELTGNQEAAVASLKQYARAQAEQAIQQAKIEEYVEYVKQQAEEEAKLTEIEEELAAAAERVAEANAAAAGARTITGGVDPKAMAELNAAVDAQNTLTEKQRELQAALDETTAHIEGIESAWEAAGGAAEDASAQTVTYEQASATAFQSVQAEIEELCEAYDEAYAAAKESFEGQFGLFDEASTKSDEYLNATVANAQKALDSQLQYWDTYLANVEQLKAVSAEDLGITQENYEALMAYVQDGSEEAAGLAQSMVNQINVGNEEAVAKLANTVGEVQAKQAETSASIADWQTNFNATMDELEQRMNEAVTNMNMSGEAEASARATIDSYAQAIRNGQGEATAAAKAVADGVAATLAANPITVNVKVNQVPGTTLPAHAHGTTNAESAFIAGEEGPELIARKADAYAVGTTDSSDFYIAGEHGPELIVGQQGSTVFPHEETEKIIRELSEPEQAGGYQDSRSYSTAYYYGDENHYATYSETAPQTDEGLLRTVLSFFERLLHDADQMLASMDTRPVESVENVENVFQGDALQSFLSSTLEEAGDSFTTTYERNYDTDYSYGTDSHAVTNPDDHSVTFQNNYGADTVLTSLLNRLIGEQFRTRSVPEPDTSPAEAGRPSAIFLPGADSVTNAERVEQAVERVTERRETATRETSAAERLLSRTEGVLSTPGQAYPESVESPQRAATDLIPANSSAGAESAKFTERLEKSALQFISTDSTERELSAMFASARPDLLSPSYYDQSQTVSFYPRTDTKPVAGGAAQFAPQSWQTLFVNRSMTGDSPVMYDMSRHVQTLAENTGGVYAPANLTDWRVTENRGDTLSSSYDTRMANTVYQRGGSHSTYSTGAGGSFPLQTQTVPAGMSTPGMTQGVPYFLPPSVYVTAAGPTAGTTTITNAPTTAEYVSHAIRQESRYPAEAGETVIALPETEPSAPPAFVPQGGGEIYREIRNSRILDYYDGRNPDDGARIADARPAPAGVSTPGMTQGGEKVVRHILELVGKGSIDIGHSSREEVLTILQTYLKPLLMSLLRSDVFEEGDSSYEY